VGRGKEADYGPTYGPPAVDPKAVRDAETVEKLIALGYVTSTEAGKKRCPSAPRTAASFNNEGLLLRQKGDVRAASKAFERALANDSDNVSTLWNLSELLHAEGRDPDRSDQLLLRALTLGLPEGAGHAAARAVEYGKKDQRNRALALLDDALCGDCQSPALLLLRGRYRLEAERCRDAAADFEKVVKVTPRDATAQGALGLARLCLGDSQRAVQALRLSLEIDPNQPQVRAALAGLGM
jgi:tetratricopeptide (TPR) repeat protein